MRQMMKIQHPIRILARLCVVRTTEDQFICLDFLQRLKNQPFVFRIQRGGGFIQ